ncbi:MULTISPECIES: penicillin-binding transpeptidase domain-containing protein [Sphingobacterium]|uniref:beta-lactamase n=1 Tax=Sphingobacterium populi TaxID=1812824 RepID=A0ABW5UFX8_9SPHI|nr:penicillin-binding transpeptidase domain-containing protein [Sphingobacterium sp. CFCC 11742]
MIITLISKACSIIIENRHSSKSNLIFITSLWFFVLTGSATGQSQYQHLFDTYAVSGSTTIYVYNNKTWLFTDSVDAHTETLPASTFKIMNALIALEEKAVKDEHEVLKWDRIRKKHFDTEIDSWNKDTDLKTAYKNSTIWFFVRLAEKIGRTNYQQYLEKCDYGNANLSEKGTDFWNYGDFGITPKNQVEFLVHLHENKVPFSSETSSTVKEIMISEKTDAYILREKTGWTRKADQDIGWWVGYIETPEQLLFFATRIKKDVKQNNPNFSKARKEITKSILSDMSIFID